MRAALSDGNFRKFSGNIEGQFFNEEKNPCKILDEFSGDEKMCCELPLYIISDGFGKINFSEKKNKNKNIKK